VNMNGLKVNATFGDITRINSWFLMHYPVDGVLGLSASNSTNSIPNFLTQLAPSLASPVMTIHFNSSYNAWYDNTPGDVEFMFGSKALPQCNQQNWQTIQLNPQYKYQWAMLNTVNTTSFSISNSSVNGPCDNSVATAPHKLKIIDSYSYIAVSVQVMNVFKKASGAQFNSSYFGDFTLDCSIVSTLPRVNVGLGDGSTLVLAPWDYIVYDSYYNVCFLNAYGSYDEDNLYYSAQYVRLGLSWLTNHCISYDINANTLSYTDALPNNGN